MNPIELLLGTAMWAWTVDKSEAFKLLDDFYAAGYRQIDAATNYPINKNAADFRAAEQILLEWIKAHGVTDLQVLMKVGSINNLYTPEHNLSPTFLQIIYNEYRNLLGSQLYELMIHWDNREEIQSIRASLEALDEIRQEGIKIGLSGIKYPQHYAALNADFGFDFDIQFKHNLIYSDYEKYRAFQGKRRFLAYGMNAGGLKFQTQQYHANSSTKVRGVGADQHQAFLAQVAELLADYNQNSGLAPLSHFNQCSMVFAFYSPDIKGMLIGPSSTKQLADSIHFFQELQTGHHQGLYTTLIQLQENG